MGLLLLFDTVAILGNHLLCEYFYFLCSVSSAKRWQWYLVCSDGANKQTPSTTSKYLLMNSSLTNIHCHIKRRVHSMINLKVSEVINRWKKSPTKSLQLAVLLAALGSVGDSPSRVWWPCVCGTRAGTEPPERCCHLQLPILPHKSRCWHPSALLKEMPEGRIVQPEPQPVMIFKHIMKTFPPGLFISE